MIEAKEDDATALLPELENLRAALILNAATMDKVMESAPDLPLLGMVTNLTSRLNNLESRTRTTNRITVEDFNLESQSLSQLKTSIARLGTEPF